MPVHFLHSARALEEVCHERVGEDASELLSETIISFVRILPLRTAPVPFLSP